MDQRTLPEDSIKLITFLHHITIELLDEASVAIKVETPPDEDQEFG